MLRFFFEGEKALAWHWMQVGFESDTESERRLWLCFKNYGISSPSLLPLTHFSEKVLNCIPTWNTSCFLLQRQYINDSSDARVFLTFSSTNLRKNHLTKRNWKRD